MKKNIILGLVFQSIAMICSFFLVPNALVYLGDHSYGVWITFLGIAMWIGSLDFGIGNGYRNELARAFAKKNDSLYLRQVISTGIFVFLFICCLITFMGIMLNYYALEHYYSSVFNPKDLFYTMLILIIGFSLDIVLKTTGIIYTAQLRSTVLPFISALAGLISLIAIVFLRYDNMVMFNSKIITYSLFVGLAPLYANFIVTIYAYITKFIRFYPATKYVKVEIIKSTFKQGWQFFLIQLFMILSLQLYNIFITTWSSASNVSSVSVAEKYFGLISVLGTVVLFPFWSKFTEADEKKEYLWIKTSIAKLEKYFVLVAVGSFMMLLAFGFFKNFWVGNLVNIPFSISLLVMLKYLALVFSSIYCYYLNGIGKLRIQMWLYFVIALLNYPVSYFGYKFLGVAGILLWPALSFFVMGLILRYVVKNDISSKIKFSIL